MRLRRNSAANLELDFNSPELDFNSLELDFNSLDSKVGSCILMGSTHVCDQADSWSNLCVGQSVSTATQFPIPVSVPGKKMWNVNVIFFTKTPP